MWLWFPWVQSCSCGSCSDTSWTIILFILLRTIYCIIFACILPSGMVILRHIPNWFKSKALPIEIKWILLILLLGLLSSTFSQNQWATLKSTILFIFSGPLIFISTKLLLRQEKDREMFLLITSLILFSIGCFGLYEYIF